MNDVLTPAEYRALVDHSPVMIWRSGTDALCNWFNDTWLAFTGRTIAQEIGNGWAEGVHPDDLKPCVDRYLSCFEKREAFEMEYRLRRHDGVYRYILDRGAPIYGDDGAFKGFIGSCVDIEERREKLESAQRFESWMVEIVSHDIRNPLGVIDLAARAVMSQASDPEAVRKNASRATRGVDRIKHIVGDLLDLSRARHGGVPVNPRPVDLHRLCADVVDEFREAAGARKLTLEVDGEDGAAVWDQNRIAQALSNLVSNAIQHSPAGSAIAVRAASRGNPVVIEVHNDGHIAEDVRPFLFNPFATAGGKGRGRTGGLGLGLFIAKAIVEAHAGEVQVDSSPERGTAFRIVLPREAAAARSVA